MIVTSRRGGDRTDKENMRVICSDCTEHRLCHVRVPIGLYRKIKGNEASFAEVVRECLIKFLHENKDEEYKIRQSESKLEKIVEELIRVLVERDTRYV
jgi:predicted CopG family antitoxin